MDGGGAVLSIIVGSLILFFRFGRFGLAFDPPWMRVLLRSSAPLFGAVVFWLLYDNQDILLLNYFKVPDDQIGLFAAAIKIIDVLKVLPVLLTSVSFPILARLASQPDAFRQKARSLIGWTLASFPLIVGGMYVLSPWVIQLLYGHAYIQATPLLRTLLLRSLYGLGCKSRSHVFAHCTRP